MRLSRRVFIAATATTGAGLALGYYVLKRRRRDPLAYPETVRGAPGELRLSALLRIRPDGKVCLVSKQTEVGQGVKTSLPMVIAEELDADWSDVLVEQGNINWQAFGSQYTGGSQSIRTNLADFRRLGATARAMLVEAAARRWNVPMTECSTAAGVVRHALSGQALGYGALAGEAAKLPVPVPGSVALKDPKHFKLLGKRVADVDTARIVTGAPLYASDLNLPGMLHAVFERSPVPGGRVASANFDEIKKLPGVRDAFVLEEVGGAYALRAGVAIVASNTWAALRARQKLAVTWDDGPVVGQSWDAFVEQAREVSTRPAADVQHQEGDVSKAFEAAAKIVRAEYIFPFLAHAAMEPLSCTAWLDDGVVKLWTVVQDPSDARSRVSKVLGLPASKVQLNSLRCGGSFGRRLSSDFVVEAAAIAKRVRNPVKLTWSREDDMRHDHYRGGGFHFLRAGLDAAGRVTAWHDRFVTFGQPGVELRAGMDSGGGAFAAGWVPNCLIERNVLPCDIPIGPWRSPGENANVWVIQSFIDELAFAAGEDSLEFLLRWLDRAPPGEAGIDVPRLRRVLTTLAERGDWGNSLTRGRGRGLAFFYGSGAYVAHMVEVTVSPQGKLAVDRVVCVCDAGAPIVNLSGAEAQAEGSIIDGLASAWVQQIDIRHGRTVQGNFNTYPMLTMADVPKRIEVHFLPSVHAAAGLGEPMLPSVAPALCNAIFRASGVRVRRLPISSIDLSWS